MDNSAETQDVLCVEAVIFLCYDVQRIDSENSFFESEFIKEFGEYIIERTLMFRMNIKKWNYDKFFWIINTVILFCYAIDIGGFPNKLAIVWIGLAGLYCWKKKYIIKLNIREVLLAIGMVCHAAIYKYYSPDFSLTLTLSLAVVPVLFFLLGRQMVRGMSDGLGFERRAEIVTMAIAVGMFVHALLNFYVWTQEHSGSFWDDFWPDQLCTVSTQHSFLSVAVVSLIAYAFYYITKKWYYSIFILLIALIGNIINILCGNRMVLAITAVILGMNGVIYVYLNRKEKRTWYIVLATVAGVAAFTFIILGLNLGGIKDTQYFYNLINKDGGIIHNIRFQIHAEAASQLLSHWKGGGTMMMAGLNSAHNYWLELANRTGLASFIPTVAFTVIALIDVIKLILDKNISAKLKYLLPSVFMSLFLYHYMEVGGTARPDYFLYVTVMAGVVYQTRREAREAV